ncbi:class I SAM-dependent methyltransferase [Melghirimyces algeriensis]|nr:class I SAM-dependent methyltransferase [Melghirimyces algeriensis]
MTMDRDWDEVYASGDFQNYWDFAYPSPELVAFVAGQPAPKGAVALDVGCGAGREAIFLAEQGYQVIGVDLSPSALKIAEGRASKAGVTVDWRQGNALDLPLDDQSVSLVNDRGCFHVISETDRPQYVNELVRVMKPGAVMLLRGCREENPESPFVRVSEEVVDRLFGEAFDRGPVLPVQLIANAHKEEGLNANLVILRRKGE